ncbi:MAG: hypothetical protein FWD66_10130 [Paludibacter sp.]|nr:hypothetical protein [Paludibacter sp.]
MSKKDKIGALNVTKGTTGRIVGAALGGATSAVYDKYINPMLPDSMSTMGDTIKVCAGIAIPMVVKNNQMVNSISDGLLTVGIANLIGGLLGDKPATSGIGANVQRNRMPFPAYVNKYVAGATGNDRRTPKTARMAVNGAASRASVGVM